MNIPETKRQLDEEFVQNIKNARCGDAVPVVELSQSTLNKINDILNEREGQYGSFVSVAETSQALKCIITSTMNRHSTYPRSDISEALSMICSKIARICNGDPEFVDSWRDIEGYAKLVADRLQGDRNA